MVGGLRCWVIAVANVSLRYQGTYIKQNNKLEFIWFSSVVPEELNEIAPRGKSPVTRSNYTAQRHRLE